jgi:hypothetical protein
MAKKQKASDLYKQGRFNYANLTHEADGSTTITCDGVQAPGPYTFRAKAFLTDKEEILEEDVLEVEP